MNKLLLILFAAVSALASAVPAAAAQGTSTSRVTASVTAPAEASVPACDFIVAADGSGHFRTVQDAINAAPDYCKQAATVIYIKAGTYREKVIVPPSKQRLHLIGENAERTIITWGDYALKNGPTGYPMGTSATSTVFFHADDFLVENLTIENSSGEGKQIAQACAVTVDADRIAFVNCRFIGNQDTIYTLGKGQHQYFKNCWIEGTTDFIFGASTCWFENCTILCKKNSYITAASTPESSVYGYVFNRCRILHDGNATRCYLGRPWRKFAKTVYINCEMGDHILPEGWHDWNKPYAHSTVFYAEYGSTGPGAKGPRAEWAHRLKRSELGEYSVRKVMDAGTEEDKNGNQIPVEWFFKVF